MRKVFKHYHHTKMCCEKLCDRLHFTKGRQITSGRKWDKGDCNRNLRKILVTSERNDVFKKIEKKGIRDA